MTSASDIGTPVSATDPDTGDTLEYSLEGTDMDEASGSIATKRADPDQESGRTTTTRRRTSYSVRVRVV